MSNSSHEPARWLEQPEDGLPDELLSQLASYRQRGPTPEQHARMAESLAPALEAAPVAGSAPRLVPRGVWFGAAGALIIGAAIATLVWLRPHAATRTAATPALPAQPGPPARLAPVGASDVAQQQAASSNHLEPTAGTLPASSENAPGRSARAEPALSTASSAAASSDPAQELQLLTPARKLLAVDPARALELTTRHARSFPNGVFAQEREVIGIDALLRLGRRALARQRAETFRRRYPGSTHLDRIAQILASE